MKIKKRVMSIILVIILTIQSIGIAYADETSPNLNEEQLLKLKEIDKELMRDKQAISDQDSQQNTDKEINNIKKNVIIKYKSDAKKEFKKELINENESRKNKAIFGKDIESMELTEAEIQSLKQDPEILIVEEDANVQTLDKESEEGSKDDIPWNISYVNADLVQDQGYAGKGVKVAIFDTGIDTDSPDLDILDGVTFVEGTIDYDDDNGHGTAMAGILSSLKNDYGTIGIAPEVQLYAVKVLDSNGTGNYSSIIEGLQWAIDNDIDIISMSFGGTQYSQILEEAICEASSNGITIIAAAGNRGINSIDYPAKFNKVICVGAVDSTGKKAAFSNYGHEMDLVAPGVNITSISIGGNLTSVSGTSASVPHVVGVVAQILDANKKLTTEGIKAILYNSTTPMPNIDKDQYGWGVVNAYNSLENINSNLSIDEDNLSNIKFNMQNIDENGEVSASYIIYGDYQTISVGQTAEVRGGFNSNHSQLEITVENSSGGILYPVYYRSPISANAYVTYTTPAFTSPGEYIIRYHCSDNAGSTFDDLFHITVTSSPTQTPTPTPIPGDDYGNSASSAYNMSVLGGGTTSRNGRLEVANDVDYFKFTAPSTGTYSIYSSNSSVDVKGWLYNSSQASLANNDDSNGTYEFTMNFSLTQGQVYFVKVGHYNLNGTGAYTLNITAPGSAADDYGNTYNSAYNLSLSAGSTISKNGSLEVANDVDYFKFTAPNTGIYNIYSSNITVDLKGWLYNSAQTLLQSNDDSNGSTNFFISRSLTQGQVYYIKVGHYNFEGTGTYTLNIACTSTIDDYGNTFATAYNMSVSSNAVSSRNGTLEIANDVDFFKFIAPTTGSYTINSSNSTVDVRGWLYNSSQVEIANNDDSNGTTNFSMTYTLTQGQVYYVKVSHYSLGGTGTYTISITPNGNTVTYNGNGNTAGTEPLSQTWISGSTLTLRANTGTLAKTGYTFAGWNTNASGTGTNYSAGQTGVNLGASSITLYAKWTPNTNTVTYNGNYNSSGSVPASQTWTSGSLITLRTNTGLLAKNGFTFSGWNTNTAGTGTNYTAGQTGVNLGLSSLILYAKWLDTTAPTVPTNFVKTSQSETQVAFSWTSSTDNVGVIGYNIYRNSSLIGTTTSTSYIDNISSLSSGTYSYTIQAKDEMENLSGLSNAVSVTTTISDWYRVTGSDEYGNTATVYLSDIAATEDGNLVTAIAQSSLDGGFWQKLIYDGYSWDYSGIAFTGDPFSGVSVATIQDPFVNNNYNFSTFEDITLNTNDNTSIIQTSAINIKEINYDSVKNSILNMILGQLGIGEGDFEPDDLYYLAQGISVGIDDNLTLGIAQKIFKLKTSYDEYFFIEGKKITDASFLAYYSLAATGSATASGYLLASATLKASGGGLCLATVGGAPLGASLEVSAAADATVASALAIQSVLLAAAAENSKTNLESTGTAERNLPTKNAGNFRSRLSTLTGKIFDRFTHAHHMFPQKKALKQFFVDKGIDIHDAKYGSWVPAFKHLSESRAFNKAWETWIESNQNATIEVIIQKARDLAIQFGYEINF